jgi:hypothetical protein
MKGNFMMYSCKEASFLISKQEEGKLNLVQRMKLRMHLAMCEFCKRFETQSRFIARHAHRLPQQDLKLPAEKKEAISENLRG